MSDYKKEVVDAIQKKQSIVLRTKSSDYIKNCIEVLVFLTKEKQEIVAISFNNPNLINKFKKQAGDSSYLELIDVSSEEDLDNVINDLGNINLAKKAVVLISPHNLSKYKGSYQIESFYENLVSKIGADDSPFVVIMHTSTNLEIIEIISSQAQKIISMKKYQDRLEKIKEEIPVLITRLNKIKKGKNEKKEVMRKSG